MRPWSYDNINSLYVVSKNLFDLPLQHSPLVNLTFLDITFSGRILLTSRYRRSVDARCRHLHLHRRKEQSL